MDKQETGSKIETQIRKKGENNFFLKKNHVVILM